MSQDTVEALIERWMRDEDFRSRMRTAPVETAEAEGFLLSSEEKHALGQLDMSQTDEELARHANFA